MKRIFSNINYKNNIEFKSINQINTMPPVEESIGTYVDNLIKQNKVIVFSKTTCPYCDKVKELFKNLKVEYVTIELDRVG